MNSSTRGHSRATIVDVAKKAGVSIATVSRVINETAPVASKTRAQVQAAIRDLNYRPRYAAQVLARQQTKTIGLLFNEIGGDFFSPMLRGIEAEASRHGFSLLVYSTHGRHLVEVKKPLPLGEHNTDGVLVFVDSVSDRTLEYLCSIEFPVVLIHRRPPGGMRIPYVTIENKRGTIAMMEHLIEVHGYHHIAFLRGHAHQEDVRLREAGYRECLTAHNLPINPQSIVLDAHDRVQAAETVEQWLGGGDPIDAIFAADNESAIGALNAVYKTGLRVPDDIAVVGFDDTYLCDYLDPPLTTVRALTEEVGCKATEELIKLIQGEDAAPVTLLPTELMIRRSCGCTASQQTSTRR